MKGKVISFALSIVTASTFSFNNPAIAQNSTRDVTVNGIKFTNVPVGKIPMDMAELKRVLEDCRNKHEGDPTGIQICELYPNRAMIDLGYAYTSGKEPSAVILRDMTPDEIKAEKATSAAGRAIVPPGMPDVPPGMNLFF